MKKDIHPEYFEDARITCACGAVYQIGSTKKEMSVELCANCHPFYTGKQKIIDTARRVEKFQERLTRRQTTVSGKKTKQAKRATQKKAKREQNEKTSQP